MNLARNPYRALSDAGSSPRSELKMEIKMKGQFSSYECDDKSTIGEPKYQVKDTITNMSSNLRSNPYRDMYSSQSSVGNQDPTANFQDYGPILPTPPSHHRPQLGPSFAVAGPVQIAASERVEGAMGIPLFEAPNNVNWKFHGTEKWSTKGVESSWEERRLSHPIAGFDSTIAESGGGVSVKIEPGNGAVYGYDGDYWGRVYGGQGAEGEKRGVGGVAGAVAAAQAYHEKRKKQNIPEGSGDSKMIN